MRVDYSVSWSVRNLTDRELVCRRIVQLPRWNVYDLYWLIVKFMVHPSSLVTDEQEFYFLSLETDKQVNDLLSLSYNFA